MTIDLGFHPRSTGFQCEGLVYTPDGRPLQGVHPNRTGVPLPELNPGDRLELFVEAAANPGFDRLVPSSIGASTAGDGTPIYRLVRAELVERDDEVIALLHDLDVLDGVMRSLPATEPRRRRLLQVLSDAHDSLDLLDVAGTAASARAVLAPALQLPAHASAHRIIAVGHAHIDTAWLWPLRETERKCVRTFASAVRLMDEMPDFRLVCSQAAQYRWIEDQFPDLFTRIKEKVAAGQWIPVGGMWVEPDMNLPSGESIVRQLVHGQRAFEHWFGRRCTEVWIPDVFGYPGSLPQIFALAGCERFVTQKLSWNKQNAMPNHTFWWQGIDGTRVLTHFPPVDTYNAEMVPKEISFASANFRDGRWSDWSLMPYGYGNGGGGPTREMVERARRLADLDGSPRVELGTVEQFFEAVEDEIAMAASAGQAPVWVGELYFEMHRGTYTSQIGTKLGNRQAERLLREAELWWANAGHDDGVANELDALWKEVLLHQFHDILPGSSIAWVHEEAELALARVARAARRADRSSRWTESAAPTGSIANVRTHAADEVVVAETAAPGNGPQQLLTDGRHAYRVAAAGLAVTALEALPVSDRVVVRAAAAVERVRRRVARRPRPARTGARPHPRPPRAAAGIAGGGTAVRARPSRRVRGVGHRVVGRAAGGPGHGHPLDRRRRAGAARRVDPGDARVRRLDGIDHLSPAGRQPPHRHRARHRLAGSGEGALDRRSPSTSMPTRPRAASSSGTSTGPRIAAPRGMRRSSRCAPTVGSTWRSRASASPCSTTGASGTMSRAVACGSPCCARRSGPISMPIVAATARPWRSSLTVPACTTCCGRPRRSNTPSGS